jgi:hypothetical protein
MNPLEHRILEILEASCDGHSSALDVFNVLNTNGYNVTKHEFEGAWKHLHDCTFIAYGPIRTSLIDTVDLFPRKSLRSRAEAPRTILRNHVDEEPVHHPGGMNISIRQ